MSATQFANEAKISDGPTVTDTNETEFLVYVVEDDANVRRSMLDVIAAMSFEAIGFESAERFLAEYDEIPGVLLCDLRMPGMSGLELQKALADRHLFVPFVMITGFAKARFVAEAIKNGAISVLEKPFSNDDLWISLRAAAKSYRNGLEQHRARMQAKKCLATLLPKELNVLKLILEGATNKSIARKLDVSVRTVESRRQKIFRKMNVESIVELVRAVDSVELDLN